MQARSVDLDELCCLLCFNRIMLHVCYSAPAKTSIYTHLDTIDLHSFFAVRHCYITYTRLILPRLPYPRPFAPFSSHSRCSASHSRVVAALNSSTKPRACTLGTMTAISALNSRLVLGDVSGLSSVRR